MKFKFFETLDNLKNQYTKILNEADEDEAPDTEAEDTDEGGDEEDTPEEPEDTDMESPDAEADPTMGAAEGEPQDSPEQMADEENGVYISNIEQANNAKLLLQALMTNPPDSNTIPNEFFNADGTLNVSDKNYKNVVALVKTLTTDTSQTDKFKEQLNHV